MSRPSRFFSAALLALALVLALPAAAQDAARLLDAPRAAGQVGERYDGLAVVRAPTASAELRALVERVNAERRAVYRDRAAAERTTPEAVGRIYAAEIVKAAPAGTWFLQESGSWVRK